MRKREVLASVLSVVMASTIPATHARAGEHSRFIHSFSYTYPAYDSPGGYYPGPVTGHQTGDDPATWALYSVAQGGDNKTSLLFKLSPPAPGGTHWTEARLYNFPGRPELSGAYGPVVFNPAGAAYGLLNFQDCTGVFRLSPPVRGYFWNFKSIVDRPCSSSDPDTLGASLNGDLVVDAAGAIYGGTAGNYFINSGIVGAQIYRLTPPVSGTGAWTTTILHHFTPQEGEPTNAPLILGPRGEIYGTATTLYTGSIYRLSPPVAGSTQWSFATLFSSIPVAAHRTGTLAPYALLHDVSGTLFATGSPTEFDWGAVFRLDPPAPKQTSWTETDIHHFTGPDGANPNSLARFSPAGPIFGTTERHNTPVFPTIGGIVFRLDPDDKQPGGFTESIVTPTEDREGTLQGPLVRDPDGHLYTSMQFGESPFNHHQLAGTVIQVIP